MTEALDRKNKELATLNGDFENLQSRFQETRKVVVELENKLQQAEAEKLKSKV